ncbi:hypothetical protein LJB86_01755 [Deltaproteobacteria bacterium OttesenSCG-928-M10]|nr:hypothetical protein [Deltaproteobacteria bacterium OttesenSCG-928-M10]
MIITFQNFIYTTEDDQVLIWQWRNSERVRRRMINQEMIEFDAHQRWVTGLTQRNDCRYFLVHDGPRPIGSLYFTSIDQAEKTAEWGFYLGLNTRTGFGLVGFLALEHFFNDWGFAELHSRVLMSNKKSYARHRELLFSDSSSHVGTENAIIHMVLDREAWLDKSANLRERLFSGCSACRAIWRE